MKMLPYLILFALMTVSTLTSAAPGPVKNMPFTKVIYLATPAGDHSGRDYSNAKQLDADADLWDIPAGAVIENVYVIVDQAVLGTSTAILGDDDSTNGFIVTGSLDTYLATPQMLAYASTAKGTYLKDSSSNPQAKYYSASGKEVKWDATGTLGATGKLRVVIQGYRHAYP